MFINVHGCYMNIHVFVFYAILACQNRFSLEFQVEPKKCFLVMQAANNKCKRMYKCIYLFMKIPLYRFVDLQTCTFAQMQIANLQFFWKLTCQMKLSARPKKASARIFLGHAQIHANVHFQ